MNNDAHKPYQSLSDKPSFEDNKTRKKIDSLRASKKSMQRFATLLDDAIRIPFLNIKIGLDALIGIVPVVGDIVGALLSTIMVWKALRLRAPKSMVMKMLVNILLELLLGLIPVVGDFFDLVWRSNRKNYNMLAGYIDDCLDDCLNDDHVDDHVSSHLDLESKAVDGLLVEDVSNEKDRTYLTPLIIALTLFAVFTLGIYYVVQLPSMQTHFEAFLESVNQP
ncbi:MAG: DUF4112 domain-containing protein [Pseudomonadales bacterium]|nr:DUF4112 domain-containing protein [Pseudomonadales bacterium]